MTISVSHLQPVAALVSGTLILVIPRLLNYIVAIYLILVGIIGPGHMIQGPEARVKTVISERAPSRTGGPQ